MARMRDTADSSGLACALVWSDRAAVAYRESGDQDQKITLSFEVLPVEEDAGMVGFAERLLQGVFWSTGMIAIGILIAVGLL